VWVPFVSESKQAISSSSIIIKEIKLALQELGRRLQRHVSGKRRIEMQRRRRQIFDRYLPEVAIAVAKLTNKKPEPILNKLKDIMKKSIGEIADGEDKGKT
jgi:DNA topoisomerase-6 subunit B